jgi:membrane-bound lytic murein transglycosylase MltF
MTTTLHASVLSAALILTANACGGSRQDASPAAPPSATSAPAQAGQQASASPNAAQEEPLPATPSPYDALPEEARKVLDQPFTGDADEMVKRRLIRAGVVFNRTQYFIDKGVQRGMSYEALRLFEEQVNKRLKTGLMKVHVAIVPLTREQLFPALTEGKVDLVAAALTITPERQKVADFSSPTRTNVSEIVVTAPNVPAPATADDLSGREVFVRRSSSYYESLQQLNASLKNRGKPLVIVKEAPDALEDDDIL